MHRSMRTAMCEKGRRRCNWTADLGACTNGRLITARCCRFWWVKIYWHMHQSNTRKYQGIPPSKIRKMDRSLSFIDVLLPCSLVKPNFRHQLKYGQSCGFELFSLCLFLGRRSGCRAAGLQQPLLLLCGHVQVTGTNDGHHFFSYGDLLHPAALGLQTARLLCTREYREPR